MPDLRARACALRFAIFAFSAAFKRSSRLFGAGFDANEVIGRAHAVLAVINAELEGRSWIASQDEPSIADVALYSYVARAPEGNVDLSGYPEVNAWLDRIEALPGFVPFQQTPVGLAAAA